MPGAPAPAGRRRRRSSRWRVCRPKLRQPTSRGVERLLVLKRKLLFERCHDAIVDGHHNHCRDGQSSRTRRQNPLLTCVTAALRATTTRQLRRRQKSRACTEENSRPCHVAIVPHKRVRALARPAPAGRNRSAAPSCSRASAARNIQKNSTHATKNAATRVIWAPARRSRTGGRNRGKRIPCIRRGWARTESGARSPRRLRGE